VSTRRLALVVEDDEGIREMIVDALHSIGWAAITATDGREALAMLAGSEPDVVVLDLVLSVMDGPGRGACSSSSCNRIA
jgi:CheY-like chemotaxis protein